jgi:hypothetical protein
VALSQNLILCPVVILPICLWIKHPSGVMTRFLLLSDSCGFVDVGRCLWWVGRSAGYNSCWASPARSFLGPISAGLVTIFYCLRFEISLFVDSYSSQGYGGNLDPATIHDFSGSLQLAYLYALRTVWIWNTVCKSYSIVVFFFFSTETCLPIRCINGGCTPLFIHLLRSNGCTHYIMYILEQGSPNFWKRGPH